jgi:hypothetical protein
MQASVENYSQNANFGRVSFRQTDDLRNPMRPWQDCQLRL